MVVGYDVDRRLLLGGDLLGTVGELSKPVISMLCVVPGEGGDRQREDENAGGSHILL